MGQEVRSAAVLAPEPGAEYDFREGCRILELANSEADPGLSIARARVPAGTTTRWHRLRGTSERYVILSGQALVEVGELPPTPVGPGAVVRIPPLCRQRITATGPEELVFLALCTPRFRPECYEDLEAAGGGAPVTPGGA
jgi:mannose-6-phosphate isomerase-like protein (cupin superfamily)